MTRLAIAVLLTGAIAVGACQCESPTAQVTPPDVDDAPPVEADDFQSRIVDAACSSYRSCDNDVFRGGVFHLFYLPVQMSFDDALPMDVVDESKALYEEVVADVEAQSPPMLPDDRCPDFAGLVTGFLGLDAGDIAQAIDDGKVDYDADAAGACIARIEALPSPCESDRGAVGDEFNMQQYRAVASRHEGEIEAHYEPCRQIFSGHLDEEQSCTYIYECAEGHCEWYEDDDTGHCGPERRGSWLVP